MMPDVAPVSKRQAARLPHHTTWTFCTAGEKTCPAYARACSWRSCMRPTAPSKRLRRRFRLSHGSLAWWSRLKCGLQCNRWACAECAPGRCWRGYSLAIQNPCPLAQGRASGQVSPSGLEALHCPTSDGAGLLAGCLLLLTSTGRSCRAGRTWPPQMARPKPHQPHPHTALAPLLCNHLPPPAAGTA